MYCNILTNQDRPDVQHKTIPSPTQPLIDTNVVPSIQLLKGTQSKHESLRDIQAMIGSLIVLIHAQCYAKKAGEGCFAFVWSKGQKTDIYSQVNRQN